MIANGGGRWPSGWRPSFFCAGPGASRRAGALAEKIQLCARLPRRGRQFQDRENSLARGQPAFFILNQLFLMREGVRKVEAMAPIVKDLKDEDLDSLSKHFAALPPKRSDETIDPALAKQGAEIAGNAALRLLSSAEAGRQGSDAAARQAADRLSDRFAEGISATPRRAGGDTAMSANLAGATDADSRRSRTTRVAVAHCRLNPRTRRSASRCSRAAARRAAWSDRRTPSAR